MSPGGYPGDGLGDGLGEVGIGETCCGACGPGLCYVDEVTGENSDGWAWQYR